MIWLWWPLCISTINKLCTLNVRSSNHNERPNGCSLIGKHIQIQCIGCSFFVVVEFWCIWLPSRITRNLTLKCCKYYNRHQKECEHYSSTSFENSMDSAQQNVRLYEWESPIRNGFNVHLANTQKWSRTTFKKREREKEKRPENGEKKSKHSEKAK